MPPGMSRGGKVLRRCFFFNPDGTQRGEGCDRSSATCRYVHPSDPEWDYARNSHLPQRRPYVPSRREDPLPYRRRSRSPSPRSASPPPYRHRLPPSHPRDVGESRHYEKSATLPSVATRGRQASPSNSIASSSNQRPIDAQNNEKFDSPSSSGNPLERKPVTSGPTLGSNRLATDTERETLPASGVVQHTEPPVAVPQRSSASISTAPITDVEMGPPLVRTFQPPPPQAEPPLPPLPPRPTLPPFLAGPTIKILPSIEKLSPAEKAQVWNERIELIARSAQMHTELRRIEKDKDLLRRTLTSSRLDQSTKESLTSKLNDMEERCRTRKAELENLKSKLSASETWPVTRVVEFSKGSEKQYTDMLASVKELHGLAEQICNALDESTITKPDAGPDAQTDVAYNPPTGSARPGKRRRLSDGEVTDEHTSIVTPTTPSDLTSDQFDALSERLASVESRLATFQNDITAHDDELRQELKDCVESKLHEVRLAKAEFDAQQALPEKLGALQTQFGDADRDINVMASEIADLITDADSSKEIIATLKADLAKEIADTDAMQAKITEVRQGQIQSLEEIKALNEKLRALQLTPPDPAPGISEELIMPLLHDRLSDSIRASMLPYLQLIREQVEGKLRVQKDEMSQTLVAKLDQTQTTLDSIASHITKLST